MSKDDVAGKTLTDHDPPDIDGQPDGAPTVRTPWLSPEDGPPIRSEVTDLNVCKSCGQAIPIGSRSCPGCGKFALGNSGSGRRHRKGDIDQILKNLTVEYAP